jgi:hypothetical protein
MTVISTSPNGVVDNRTIFFFREVNNTVWAYYSGGDVVKGFLTGMRIEGKLHFTYCQLELAGRFNHGTSVCDIQHENGKLRLIERFISSNEDSEGVNVFEQIL